MLLFWFWGSTVVEDDEWDDAGRRWTSVRLRRATFVRKLMNRDACALVGMLSRMMGAVEEVSGFFSSLFLDLWMRGGELRQQAAERGEQGNCTYGCYSRPYRSAKIPHI